MTLGCVDNRAGTVQAVLVNSKNATPRSSAKAPRSDTSNGHTTPAGVLHVMIISVVAVAVAVFGHPTQAIAAAVIAAALAALVGGPQVLDSSAEVLRPLARFLSSTRATVATHVGSSDRPPLVQSHDDGSLDEDDESRRTTPAAEGLQTVTAQIGLCIMTCAYVRGKTSEVTLCDRHEAMAAVIRGLVRGPSHWRKWVQWALCRLRSAVSVQVLRPERQAGLLVNGWPTQRQYKAGTSASRAEVFTYSEPRIQQ